MELERNQTAPAEKARVVRSDEDSELTYGNNAHGDAPKEPPEMDIDPEDEITGYRLILIHTGICLCTFLIGLDFNLIATAVPIITSEFNSVRDVGWYGSAFYIALCSTQPLAGKMFVQFSKKWVYLLYFAIFEIGSLVCALAPSSNALIAGRVVAGLGASGVFAGGFILLTTIIPLAKRAIWTGTMSSTFAIASIVGPVIGGAFTQRVTWRWCFYINLPIGGLATVLILSFFRIKTASAEKMSFVDKVKGLDGVGFALFAASITMLLLALQFGGNQYAWNSSVIIGLFVGFAITMIAFIPWQLYLKDKALIPIALFKYRNAILIFASSTFVNGPFQTIVYWLPIWFQAVLDVSPEASGVRYLPTVISDALASIIGAGLVMQLGIWNPFLLFAEAMVSLGAGLLTTIYPGISDGHWIGFQILGGIGYSLASNIAHLGLQASLPQALVPVGATTLLFGISTSCAIFLSIGQTVFNNRLFAELEPIVSTSTAGEIIAAGATNFRGLVGSEQLAVVVHAYSDAVTQVFYIPAAAPVVSFILVLGCRWISIKKSDSKQTRDSHGKTQEP